jgi:hypothetical protein
MKSAIPLVVRHGLTNLQDAVDLLNTLQTPFGVLKQRRDAGIFLDEAANGEMRRCLDQIGYSVFLLFLSEFRNY